MLRETTRASDPRIEQAERRIAVIEERIEAERAVLGAAGDGTAFADLVDEYERLSCGSWASRRKPIPPRWPAMTMPWPMRSGNPRYLATHITPDAGRGGRNTPNARDAAWA